MFEAVLRAPQRLAGLPAVPQVEFASYHVQRGEYPAAQSCDAYLITGSRHSVYDGQPWIPELVAFLRQVLARQRKVIGICFGHQLIAHYFGGETRAAEVGWCVGVHRAAVLSQEPWMQPSLAAFNLLSSHKDQAVRLPEGARRFAASSACPNAGFVMGEHILTFQGHPEFSKPYARDLMNMRKDVLGAQRFEAGLESLREPLDNPVVARWILNFILS